MTNIVAFAGRKKSGKNTCANFIVGLELVSNGIIDHFGISEDGKLMVPYTTGDIAPLDISNVAAWKAGKKYTQWLEENVWPHVRLFSFADILKKNVCMDILGLTYEQCYGEHEKESLTDIEWGDIPNVTTKETLKPYINGDMSAKGLASGFLSTIKEKLIYKKAGKMKAREVMQHIGTDIFRKIYNDIWCRALFNEIKNCDSKLIIITDCRFPNEVDYIQNNNGKVIKLTRAITNDTHSSEIALEEPQFNQLKFNYILDNQNMSIGMQNEQLFAKFLEWKFLSNNVAQLEIDKDKE